MSRTPPRKRNRTAPRGSASARTVPDPPQAAPGASRDRRGVRPTAEDAPAVRLRAATLADLGRLQQLLVGLDRRHAELHPEYFRARPRELSYLHGLIIDHDCTVIVAELRGQLVGVVSARIYDTPEDPLMTPRRRAYADDLVVVDEQRRQGIGRQLMAEVSRWARGKRAEQVVLTVWAGNDEAEALYEALGYRAISRVLALDIAD